METTTGNGFLNVRTTGAAGVPRVALPRSTSRNVNAYLKRARKAHALQARLEARHAKCVPLEDAAEAATGAAVVAWRKLTGGQMAEATRLLGATVAHGAPVHGIGTGGR
jgi:hypothetical protein